MSDNTLIFRPESIRIIAGEPRVRDLDLAQALEFTDAHKIRNLIKRHKTTLAALGEVSATVAETTKAGGRPGTEYHLNQEQAVFLCAKSETEKATAVTIEVVKTFVAFKNGTPAETDRARFIGTLDKLTPAQLCKAAEFAPDLEAPDPMPRLQAWLETTMLDRNMPSDIWNTYKHVLNVAKGLQGKPMPLIHTRHAYVEPRLKGGTK